MESSGFGGSATRSGAGWPLAAINRIISNGSIGLGQNDNGQPLTAINRTLPMEDKDWMTIVATGCYKRKYFEYVVTDLMSMASHWLL